MDRPRTSLLACLFVVGLVLLPLEPAVALARDVQDDILAQTAGLRGLPPKAPVPFAFVDADQIRRDLLRDVDTEDAIRELGISQKLLVMLGLLRPDADLHAMLVNLYAENIQGYYNHLDKKMYIVSGQSAFGPAEKVTLSHEFTHALQDQYFDLGKVRAGTEDNGDRATAVLSLIEGDATLTMLLYARQFLTPTEVFQLQNSGGASSLDSAPLVIRDETIFPYREGLLFVQRLWSLGGYQAVNDVFDDLPRSTEQIIHPEKYLAHEPPIDVTLPDLAAALGPGWTLLRSDVLGELDLRILLEQFGDPVAAARGAEGWGGDRFAILGNPAGQNALVISTVWDAEGEATEFFGAYVDTVGRRFGQSAQRTENSPARIVWATPSGSLLLQRWGARVAITMAPDDRLANALAGAVAPATPPPAQPGPVPAPVQLPR